MPIEFRCPSCRALLRVPDETAGQQAQCPECGHVSMVAGDDAGPPELPPSSEDAEGGDYGLREDESETTSSGGPPPPPPPPTPGAAPADYQGRADDAAWRASMVRAASERVSVPAIALMVLGGLDILMRFVDLLSGGAKKGMQAILGNNGPQAMVVLLDGAIGVFVQLLMIGISAVVVFGAFNMANLRRYEMATAAAVLALIPCISPCCCVSMPFGIWAIVLLMDDSIRDAFRINEQLRVY